MPAWAENAWFNQAWVGTAWATVTVPPVIETVQPQGGGGGRRKRRWKTTEELLKELRLLREEPEWKIVPVPEIHEIHAQKIELDYDSIYVRGVSEIIKRQQDIEKKRKRKRKMQDTMMLLS